MHYPSNKKKVKLQQLKIESKIVMFSMDSYKMLNSQDTRHASNMVDSTGKYTLFESFMPFL